MTALSPRWRRVPTIAWAWLGVGLLAASACGHFDFVTRAEARDEWKRTYKAARGGSFEIRNTNGRIEIGSADGDTIDVVATRVVKASTDEAAKSALAEFKIDETVSADGVVIDSTSRGMGFMTGISRNVEYRVRAPRWINVTVKSTNGDVDVIGIGGMFRADTTNGRISATGLEEGAHVETTNGLVRLEFNKLGDSGVRCNTTNGAITVLLPRDVKARVSARVTNGGISTSDLPLDTTEQSRRRLEATIGGGGPAIRLETTNGGIQIKGR